MLKYLGLAMLALSGIFISREYEKKERKRLFELSEFIRLFEHIKHKISCFLSPKSDWLSDFETESAPISEFLNISRKNGLSDAFLSVRDKLSLGSEADAILRILSSLGKTYKDGEIALLDAALSSLSEIERQLSVECEKNIKTVKVLTAAAALGLIILLI